MEKWERFQKPPPSHHHRYDYPSFSSSLLDSIYRSIDDETHETNRFATEPTKPTRVYHNWAPPVTRPKTESKKKPVITGTQLRHFPSTTSSSSDCSSYGGFSSSEPESNPTRLRPIRTGSFHARSDPLPPLPVPLQAEQKKNKKNLSAIRNRLRDLKKSRSPTSPAARLASFLNSIFASNGNGKQQQQKAANSGGEESASSTASSYSRSCLVKASSTTEHHAAKRSVRFQLPVDGGNGRRESKSKKKSAATVMTWRRDFQADDDDVDVASDSSSDLFELENLTAVGRYRDELPVYETTKIGGLFL